MLIIILGLAIVFFLCLYIAYLKGYRLTKPTKPISTEQQKQQQMAKEFDMMMDYNVNKALERRTV